MLLEGYKLIEIEKCSICKKYKLKGSWKSRSNEIALLCQLARQAIKTKEKIDNIDCEVYEDFIRLNISQGDIHEEYDIPYKITKTTCDLCEKAGSNYFVAIFQLRPDDEEVEMYIENYLKKQKSFLLSKILKTPTGKDYYFTTKKELKKLADLLVKTFGGETKSTATLHTRDNQASKDLYRLTVLYRVPKFKKGDVILLEGKLLRVTNMAKRINGVDLLTGKKKSLKYQKAKKLPFIKTQIINTKPDYQVMNEQYQPISLKTDKKFKVDQKIEVVIHDNIAYFIRNI